MIRQAVNLSGTFSDFWKRGAFRHVVPWGLFALGLGWLILRPMGLHLSIIPGVYGDTRLINYILEHFYRWLMGLDPSLWNTNAFYPYPLTLAFSDNLLGVAPLYVPFRLAGLDAETAMQFWYLLGFLVNFTAAVFVLQRLDFRPEAVAIGAFFFTFGLPMLAHEYHLQLLYRAGVPLACYALWEFGQKAKLRSLAAVVLITAWQIIAGVYIGVLLVMLLVALAIMMPVFLSGGSWRAALAFWPGRLKTAWQQAGKPGRAGAFVLSGAAGVGVVLLFRPYTAVQKLYGFVRSWETVASMLPRVQSYFVADELKYWRPVSIQLWGMPTMRNEHQLFIGWILVGLVLVGIAAAFWKQRRAFALANLGAILLLGVLTLDVNGFTLYRLIYALPGMNSIRSVTRVQLVMMWPLALLAAGGVEWIMRSIKNRLLAVGMGCLLIGLVFLEPTQWRSNPNINFSKRHAQERIEALRAMLPADLPHDPILFVGMRTDESEVITEMDGMTLAQRLGWETFNGYFGNFPPGYHPPTSCAELPARIINYMKFAGITDEGYYLSTMARSVPVGFQDCDPSWWQKMPRE